MDHLIDFKGYLLYETKSYLGQKVGDILTALQSLNDDAPNMGTRQLLSAAKGIASQIKRILHDNWPDSETTTLKTLQRIGVALMKSIDENQPIGDVLSASVQELQQASEDLGMPVNDLLSSKPDAQAGPSNQS